MKRILLLLLLFSLFSCSKESVDEGTVERLSLNASISESSKIQLNTDVKTVWNSGDKVSVFYKGDTANTCWSYSGSDKAASGKLVCSEVEYPFKGGKTYAVYPYSDKYSFSSSKLLVDIPSSQAYVAGSYGFAIMTACSDDDNLQFKYATAMVRLGLSGNGEVKSVSLKGNNNEVLCGPSVLDLSSGLPVLTLCPEADGREVVIKGEDSGVIMKFSNNSKKVLFSIAPGTYSNGFTMTMEYSNGEKKTIVHSMPVTIGAGECLRVQDIVDQKLEISLSFASDPQTTSSLIYSFPLKTKMESGGTIDVQRSYQFGTPYTFVLWAKKGYAKATAGNGARIVSLQFNPNEAAYAWMKLPGIPGWKLSEVFLDVVKNSSFVLNISSSVNDSGVGSGDVIADTPMSGESVYFKLGSPALGTSYYIGIGNQMNTQFKTLKLTYRQ